MSYFDTLKDDIMDSIFAECYESLYLELEKLQQNYDLIEIELIIQEVIHLYIIKNNTIEELASYESNK